MLGDPGDRLRGEAVERLDGQLEVLRLRVLQLRVREAAERLDEEHHRRHAGARDLGCVVEGPAREPVRRAGDLANGLLRELDQLLLWNAVCARLDLPERYDLYLTQFPFANAAAIGAGTPMVVINSRCVDLFDDLELRTVLGHEAGHILSEHVMYRTALMILLEFSGATRLPFLAGLPLMAVRMALLEWYRAAELS